MGSRISKTSRPKEHRPRSSREHTTKGESTESVDLGCSCFTIPNSQISSKSPVTASEPEDANPNKGTFSPKTKYENVNSTEQAAQALSHILYATCKESNTLLITPQLALANTNIHIPKDASVSITDTNYGVSGQNIVVHGNVCMDTSSQPNSKEESSTDFTSRVTELQKLLKRIYSAFKIKGLPWMGNNDLSLKHYVSLQMRTIYGTDWDQFQNDIKIEDMFTALEGTKKPLRILVEGGAGFGKSTLATKLAYDWAQDEMYMRQFDLVLFIRLRTFSKGWKETLITAARLREKNDYKMLLKFLEQNAKRCLVIFDGYDELPENFAGEVNSIIQREILSDITIVLTSRPGNFISSRDAQGREWFMQPAEIAVDVGQFFDKKVTIRGFSQFVQEEFISVHTSKFPEIKKSVMQDIEKMKRKTLLTFELLQCPLFFLMIVLLLRHKQNTDVQRIDTKTELYKNIFTFVIQRYFAKCGGSITPKTELFSAKRDTNSKYIRVMLQFSHFALKAIQKNAFTFSKEEVLESHENTLASAIPDTEHLIPLNVGFLTESVLEEDFDQKIVYEPIHKSLLEFAAAYYIWSTFLEGKHDVWLHLVDSLRPRKDFQLKDSASLVFPFLAGLMGEEAWMLFDLLHPYAAEYSLWFGSLKLSILEAQITSRLFTSLSPLMPLVVIVRCSEDDRSFSKSRHHEEIIRYGASNGKTKIILWDPFLEVRFPKEEVLLETVILELEDPENSWGYNLPTNGFHCQHLWCCLLPLHCKCSGTGWENAVSFVQKNHFERISFATFNGSNAISTVCGAVTSGQLQHADINWIRHVVADNSNDLADLCDMIRADKIESLELILYQRDRSIKTDTLSTLLFKQQFQGKWCETVTQQQFTYLVECASLSAKLVRFVVHNDPQNPLTVDMSLLCDRGHKSWKLVSLKGVKIHCSLSLGKHFQITHLQIINVSMVDESNKDLLSNCRVSSFACHCSKLLSAIDFSVFNSSVTELHLQIDDSINCGFPFYPIHFSNLQILVLEMTSLTSDMTLLTLVEKLFPTSSHPICLRGVELLEVHFNIPFVLAFVKKILASLCGVSTEKTKDKENLKAYTSQTKLQHMEYVMLHSEILPQEIGLISVKTSIFNFLSVISHLKSALRDQLLPRLDLVCYKEVFRYMWNVKEVGVPSLTNIFPIADGFSFEHDLYGMKDDDSIRSKELYGRSPLPHKRISITFNKDKK